MTKGKGGGISLLPDFVLNKTVLTDGEKSDILAALHAVDAVNLEQTNTAVQKLSSYLETPAPIGLKLISPAGQTPMRKRSCSAC